MDPLKRCRVCGKEFIPCRTAKVHDGVFRWREVACSPECGSVYFERILESRNPAPKKAKKSRAKKLEIAEAGVVTNSEDAEVLS